MAKKDVIISALACGGKMSCSKEAQKFRKPPEVININSSNGVSTHGGTVQGFRKAAAEYKKNGNGSIIDGVLSTKKNLEANRICLVSYLDGWSFINEIVKSDLDYELIDTIILLEGLNTRSNVALRAWNRYVTHTDGSLIMACTEAKHKTAPSKTMSKKVYLLSDSRKPDATAETWIPSYIQDAKLDKSISIYSKAETPKTKIFHEDTLKGAYTNYGTTLLEYSGNKTQDQTYIQQYVQPRIWRWLKESWERGL